MAERVLRIPENTLNMGATMAKDLFITGYNFDHEDCPERKYVPAHKSYGANLPDSCQGAVFPGDEAHHECKITGEHCDEAPRSLDDCPKFGTKEE